MAEFKPVTNLALSSQSEQVLSAIAEKLKSANAVQPVDTDAVLLNVLVNENKIPVMFNVTAEDWVLLSQKMESVDEATKADVKSKIEPMVENTKGKENKFWQSLNECY